MPVMTLLTPSTDISLLPRFSVPLINPLPEGTVPCDQCPAQTSLAEAVLFCTAHPKRLPTDPEWKLAARGVKGLLYPIGASMFSKRIL
jgi:hypothetical protein